MTRGIGITWHPEDLQEGVEYHFVTRHQREGHDRHAYGTYQGIEYVRGKYWIKIGCPSTYHIYLPFVMEIQAI